MSADNPAGEVDDEVLLKERNEIIEILDSLKQWNTLLHVCITLNYHGKM